MKDEHVKILLLLALALVAGAFGAIIAQNNNAPESNKTYIGKSAEECSRIQFICAPGYKEFTDRNGCGCEPSSDNIEEVPEGLGKVCSPESRDVQACTTEYSPVCGWFGQNRQCIRYPCAETYSNSCSACINKEVVYWTEGECPA